MTLTICRDNSIRDIGPVDYNQINLEDAIRTRQQICKLLPYYTGKHARAVHKSCMRRVHGEGGTTRHFIDSVKDHAWQSALDAKVDL